MSGPEHLEENWQISYSETQLGGRSRQAQQNFINVIINVTMIIVTYGGVRYWRFKQLYFVVSDDFVC